MSRDKKASVVIIKKGGHHEGHHGGAWKVAYADFVTAMMAFFIVMWLITQSEEVRAGVAGFFRDPVAFTGESRPSLLEGGRGILSPDVQMAPPAVKSEDEARKKLRESAKDLIESIREMPGYSELTEQIEVTMTEEGLRIQLMEGSENEESTFFQVGSSELSASGREVLARIAKTVGPLGYKVNLEGHTDSRPFPGQDRTNWELSSDRANAARRVLQTGGLAEAQVWGIRGFADRMLKYPEDPLDGRNRRIAIVVLAPGAADAAASEGASVEDLPGVAPPRGAHEAPAALPTTAAPTAPVPAPAPTAPHGSPAPAAQALQLPAGTTAQPTAPPRAEPEPAAPTVAPVIAPAAPANLPPPGAPPTRSPH